MRWARTGPTPGRASSSATPAVLRFSRPPGAPEPPVGSVAGTDPGRPHHDLLPVGDEGREVDRRGIGLGQQAAGRLDRLRDAGTRRQRHQPGSAHLAHHRHDDRRRRLGHLTDRRLGRPGARPPPRALPTGVTGAGSTRGRSSHVQATSRSAATRPATHSERAPEAARIPARASGRVRDVAPARTGVRVVERRLGHRDRLVLVLRVGRDPSSSSSGSQPRARLLSASSARSRARMTSASSLRREVRRTGRTLGSRQLPGGRPEDLWIRPLPVDDAGQGDARPAQHAAHALPGPPLTPPASRGRPRRPSPARTGPRRRRPHRARRGHRSPHRVR